MNYSNQTGNDRKEVIRLLSQYHRLKVQQLLRCFPAISESTMLSMLRRLERQGRICIGDNFVDYLPQTSPVEGMTEAFDVLLDFFPEVSYHAPGEFPVTLTFFAREDGYDIIWLPEGRELLTIHALSQQANSQNGNQRLVAISRKAQLNTASRLHQIAAFCLVTDGKIQYFKKQ